MANHQPEHLGEEFKDEKTRKPSVVEKKSDGHQLDTQLEIGVSKAALGAERFETELEDDMVFETKLEADMATLIMNWLVSSVINTLAWMLYASTQVSLNMLTCGHLFLLQMYFAILMFLVVTYLIFHRSSVTKKRKLLPYHVLFLCIVCGLSGKLCLDTLGDIGTSCLFLLAVLCLVQHFSDVFILALVGLLYSPILVTQRNKSSTSVSFWVRTSLVFVVGLLVLPLIMSRTTFATFGEYIDHFSVSLYEIKSWWLSSDV